MNGLTLRNEVISYFTLVGVFGVLAKNTLENVRQTDQVGNSDLEGVLSVESCPSQHLIFVVTGDERVRVEEA